MAALQKTPFTLQLGSLRTDVDPHLLPPNAGVLELENCVMNADGAASKRNGNVALSQVAQSGSLSNAWQLANGANGLISLSKVGPTPLARYSPSLGLWENLSATAAPTRGPISVGTVPFAGGANNANNSDVAVSGNYIALANDGANAGSAFGVAEIIIDAQTGAQIATAAPSATAVFPKVLAQNGCFVFMSMDVIAHTIIFDKWVISTLGSVSTPTTTSPAAATGSYQAFDAMVSGADSILLVWFNSDQTVWSITYTVSTATAAAAVQLKDSAGASIPANKCIGWAVQSFATSPVLLTADSTNGIKAHIFGSGLGSNATVSTVIDAASGANVRNVTGWTTAAVDYVVLYETTGTNPWQSFVSAGKKVAGVVTTGIWHRGIVLRSKPWVTASDGQIYIVCAYDSTAQPTYFLMPVSSDPVTNTYPVPAVRFQTWNAQGKSGVQSYVGSLVAYGTGAIYSSLYSVRLESSAGVTLLDKSVSVKTFSFNDSSLGRPINAAGYTWVPGGFLQAYDGARYGDWNFNIYPEGLSVAFSNGAGGLVAGATYSWIAVYRWIDAQGKVRRSLPSVPLQATVTSGNNIATVTVPNCRITSARDASISFQIELYRLPAAGGAYFRTTTAANSYNSATDKAIVDSSTDAALAAGELLYAQPGGVLASQPPPPVSFVEAYDRRLWAIAAEDPTLLWYTNQFVDGLAPFFNEALTTRIDDQYGNVTALAPMDNKLIVFKERAIYMIFGVGPDTSGNGGYQAPQLVAIGDGVAAAQVRSVISTSDGIYFLSNKGLCLLTRGLQVQYIGKPMQNYTSSFVCTGVVLMPDVTQIRWFSAAGTTIVYDYIHQIWGIHTGQPTSSVVIWNGVPVMADVAGANRYVETAGTYLERGSVYGQRITFPYLSLAGLRGFQRLYKVQGIGSTTNFTTQVGCTFIYDFDDSTAHTQNVTPNDLLWTWEARPAKQVCTAVKLKIQGAAVAGNGFTMAGLALVYGAKRGLVPIDKAKRAV